MRGKAGLVVGLAAGYVLGARDGRERYEQIKDQATRIAHDPRVQEKTSQAADLAKDKAPLVRDKVASATNKATSKVSGNSSSADDSADVAGTAPAATGTVTDVDEDVIVITPPPPGPLDPAPTPTSASEDPGSKHG